MNETHSWRMRQEARFRQLEGCSVTGWIGDEMAIREEGATGKPAFEDPACPFLQMAVLYIRVGDDDIRMIDTYQNDDTWGLEICAYAEAPRVEHQDEGSIFRTRVLQELPTGIIRGVHVTIDEAGDVAEVTLDFAQQKVTFVAGEVYEECDGSLRTVRPDESVLVYVTYTASSRGST